ncbi:hypothetical protein TCAL_16700 [Tigriopus californicus]|uniref:F-box domain-containing protein n=2 Tax=Tigriopus californicus TaxID=6832 RepID=A0A553PK24_TIGCA|nr:hypothetical protein TCAL_16700 [Tigriopus californicus]
MSFSSLPESVHHHIFQHLDDKDLESLKAVGNISLNQSLSSLWIYVGVRGVVCPNMNMSLQRAVMTQNPGRSHFHLNCINSHEPSRVQYRPNKMETKGLEMIVQYHHRLTCGTDVDPFVGSLRLPDNRQSTSKFPFDWSCSYGAIIWKHIGASLSNIVRTRHNNRTMLIQTKSALFFIDLLSGHIIWSRVLHLDNPKLAQARDFVITDQAIYMLLNMHSSDGDVLILLEFCIVSGSFKALGFNFRVSTEPSANHLLRRGDPPHKVVVTNNYDRVETDEFQLADLQSAWVEHNKLFVIAKKVSSFQMLSLSLHSGSKANFHLEFEVIAEDARGH